MKCLINQPAGLGDIFFCQKIADTFIEMGYDVIWPVVDEYRDALIRHIPKENLSFCDINSDFEMREYYQSRHTLPLRISTEDIYLPLRHADRNFPHESVMKAKYKIVNLSYDNWQENFSFNRDLDRENSLYYDILNLSDNSKYILQNSKYGSPPNFKEKDFLISQELPIVEMDFYPNFTIFDWCKVIEKAQAIYSVETSIFYLVEKLDTSAIYLECFSKHTPPTYMHVEGLFKSQWHYNY